MNTIIVDSEKNFFEIIVKIDESRRPVLTHKIEFAINGGHGETGFFDNLDSCVDAYIDSEETATGYIGGDRQLRKLIAFNDVSHL
jgi:hypothetical protein